MFSTAQIEVNFKLKLLLLNAFEVELMDKFDFDSWAMLARTAPDDFEQRRRAVIESQISSSDNVRRLRGLQCRIDMERIRARTPLKSCLRLSTLMWDAFVDLNNSLNTFVGKGCETTSASSHSARSAKIIHLATKYKPHK
jgi:Protein of unknown function (DUF3135)